MQTIIGEKINENITQFVNCLWNGLVLQMFKQANAVFIGIYYKCKLINNARLMFYCYSITEYKSGVIFTRILGRVEVIQTVKNEKK